MQDKTIEAAILAYQNYEGHDAHGMMKAAIKAYEAAKWRDAKEAPFDIPILGVLCQEPNEDQKKGIKGGWLLVPYYHPFICKKVAADEEYDEHWVSVNEYGVSVDEDFVAPTHWQPLPSLPQTSGGDDDI